MSGKLKQLAKEFLPPILVKQLGKSSRYGFFGDYKTWEEAKNASTGYDCDLILTKVKETLLKVKRGEAVHERDSVLFDEIQYSWPLLAGLLWVAASNGGKLNVLDFGGSLGSSYFQNRRFLSDLPELKWNIVEQKNFVECGKKYFEDDELKFYDDIKTCLKNERPHVIILASVIQYLEKPYDMLAEIINEKFSYIIFDRTTFLETGDNRLTIQKVPPDIYDASYPCWFFNLDKFLAFFSGNYTLMAKFDALAGSIRLGNTLAFEKGLILKKKML